MSSKSWASSVYSSSVPDLLQTVVITGQKLFTIYRLKDLESLDLNFSINLSILSLQPLPLRITGLLGVENTELRILAMTSQSAGLLGRLPTTSLAKEMSWDSSDQRNCGMLANASDLVRKEHATHKGTEKAAT